jgi:hypothetical protein
MMSFDVDGIPIRLENFDLYVFRGLWGEFKDLAGHQLLNQSRTI